MSQNVSLSPPIAFDEITPQQRTGEKKKMLEKKIDKVERTASRLLDLTSKHSSFREISVCKKTMYNSKVIKQCEKKEVTLFSL